MQVLIAVHKQNNLLEGMKAQKQLNKIFKNKETHHKQQLLIKRLKAVLQM